MSAPGPIALGILAGGRGTRFGGRDKGWVEHEGVPLVQRLLDALRPQVARAMISANRTLERYATLDAQVVADRWPDHPGPLAGLASLFAALREDWLLSVPVDALDLPADFVARMYAARGDEALHVVLAQDDDGLQPLFALYPRALAAHAIETFESGRRSVRDWQHRFPIHPCRFEGCRFGNYNAPADGPA